MTSLLSSILSYILLYKYATLFAVMVLAGIGAPLPIDILLTAVGAFTNQGYLGFLPALVIASAGNVIGDVIDYFIFRRYGHAVLREKYISKYSYFLRLERYVQEHAGLAIFVSRFVGILGPLVNFLAGFTKVSAERFIAFDILGNLCETGLLLGIGYLVGDAWSSVSSLVTLGEGLLLVAILIWIVFQAIRKNRSH